jgi:tRNA dimethylallyltransferase
LGRDRKKVSEEVTPPEKGTVLVLVGPTGVGKTDVAFHAARSLGGEIVSADSRLVYQFMDIGTAKPDRAMRQAVPHHMIDTVTPDQQYTSKAYEREARRVVGALLEQGSPPVVVGGTGLYVRALLKGIFDGPAGSEAIRKRLEDTAEREGREALWRRLRDVDPDKAVQINPNNLARVIRALEVHELAGRTMSDLEKRTRPLGAPYVKIGLRRQRGDLYARIDRRVDRMLEEGLVEEVRRLVEMGYGQAPVVRNTLGYRETLLHLEGEIALDLMADLIKKNTRNFAKRQMTWFGREPDTTWLDVTGRSDSEAIAGEVCRLYLT